MEDIEDLLIGAATGAPPGFRSPLSSVTVGVATKKIQRSSLLPSPSPSIPGTQVLHLAELVKDGKLKTIIDSKFPLGKAEYAWSKIIDGHATGKIIVEPSRAIF